MVDKPINAVKDFIDFSFINELDYLFANLIYFVSNFVENLVDIVTVGFKKLIDLIGKLSEHRQKLFAECAFDIFNVCLQYLLLICKAFGGFCKISLCVLSLCHDILISERNLFCLGHGVP